jgi:hypothetical protein
MGTCDVDDLADEAALRAVVILGELVEFSTHDLEGGGSEIDAVLLRGALLVLLLVADASRFL